MNLYESTSKATQTAETLCNDVRHAAKLANEADPLFGEIFQSYLRDVTALKNRMVTINGAAKRRNTMTQKDMKSA